MEKVKKRKSEEAVHERDLRIVTDYKTGYTIKKIMERNGVSSPQTVYNAIERFNKLVEKEKSNE